MAVELCLMASHGYPPGSGLVLHHQEQSRLFKDYQPYFPGQIGRHEIARSNSLNLRVNQLSKIEPTVAKPVLIDVQETHADSVLFSYGIAEQCVKHEKIMQFLMSGASELEREGLDLTLLSDLMGIQALTSDVHQQPLAPLLYPSGELEVPKPLVDFVGDMAHSSKLTVHPDGRVMFNGSGTEIKDILSIVAEFYLSKNLNKWRRHSILVPHFSRLDTIEVPADTLVSSLKVKDFAVAPLKSPEKVQNMPSTKKKKKNSGRGVKDRDLYERNYFHACESLLTLLMDKKGNGKAAILSLKKSGPELPKLLTQFSAGIAGTGLAVLFSVVFKVACGRVPFCSSKLFTTGFGVGLVWLSWAVNKLRNTVVYLSKNATKVGMKDEEMMKHVDGSLKEIYFRAATVMAVAVLRLA